MNGKRPIRRSLNDGTTSNWQATSLTGASAWDIIGP